MKRTRFSEEQIIGVLHEAGGAVSIREVCRKHGITEQTFFRWRAKYGGLEVSEARRIKGMEDENRRSTQSGAELAPANERAKEGGGGKGGRTRAWVDVAGSSGARASVGAKGRARPGYYYEPTVLVDVPDDAQILSEEIFGPVAPIVRFDTESDAVRMANCTEFGLVAYVYTGDLARGLRVSEQLESGMVGINRGLVSDPAAPYGGVKQSGIGSAGGHSGVFAYVESGDIAAPLVVPSPVVRSAHHAV